MTVATLKHRLTRCYFGFRTGFLPTSPLPFATLKIRKATLGFPEWDWHPCSEHRSPESLSGWKAAFPSVFVHKWHINGIIIFCFLFFLCRMFQSNQILTGEFVEVLRIFRSRWKAISKNNFGLFAQRGLCYLLFIVTILKTEMPLLDSRFSI